MAMQGDLSVALRPYQSGFSLVELSVVLVVLGLLTGSILTGQSMVRAAELRSVSKEAAGFRTAIYAFKDKYEWLPGDLPDATRFWRAAHTSPAHCPSASGSGAQTCDGNGNGEVNYGGSSNGNTYSEIFTFWQHLANAGLIAGDYTGKAGTQDYTHAVAGVNVPDASIDKGALFYVKYQPHLRTDAHRNAVAGYRPYYLGRYGNIMILGRQSPTLEPEGDNPVMTAEEMWGIDVKMDDGLPGTGDIVSYMPVSQADGGHPHCATTTVSATAAYNVTFPEVACMPIFRLGL